jgi:hypothetical protein
MLKVTEYERIAMEMHPNDLAQALIAHGLVEPGNYKASNWVASDRDGAIEALMESIERTRQS